MNRVAIVTPLKDEMDNIDRLIKSISEQDMPIETWVIVENGSQDGSKQYLENIKNIPNVKNFVVLNFSLPNETYQLGVKYSTVVSQGFNYLLDNNLEHEFVGICDADCFPSKDYYSKLTSFMRKNNISISSGVGQFEDGKPDGEAREWVRGNCRLWSWDCFKTSGYIIGPSADTLSLGKAQLMGFEARPNHSLIYTCREMGSRTRYSYYGYSSYYRGITPVYAILRFFNYLRIGQFKQSVGYMKGYFGSFFRNDARLNDEELRNFFSNTLKRKLGINK